MKILILNGPNLNKLGTRNPEIYGSETLDDINKYLNGQFPEHELSFYQSNIEGELIDRIQEAENDGTEAIVANFGAYTHTSVAIRDALEPVTMPKVEVHISNIHAREAFREQSLTGEVVNGIITGFGRNSYVLGIHAAVQLNSK
jgi:3-dehydroquinate dehydratase-2